jgi:hypothetical protein
LKKKREIFSTLGSNMILKDQKIHIEAQKPFSIIREGLPYMKTKIALLEPNENISIKGKEAACAASHPTLLRLWDEVGTCLFMGH